MEYRRLGQSGLQVSVMGLGTNSFGSRANEENSLRIIDTALDAGINFIDTANIYSGTRSESIIGKALKGRRHQVVLATKAGLPSRSQPNGQGSSRIHLFQEIEASLERLQTDYIDLYQIHSFDPRTPLEETLRALDDLVRMGKVRYIGASNYFAWELMKALGISDTHGWSRYVSIQPCYSLADRTVERELMSLCVSEGVGIIPYFPLAGGILTGKYTSGRIPQGSRGETNPGFRDRLDHQRLQLGSQVDNLAVALGYSPSDLALAWLYTRPAVSTVIVGATKPEQVAQNLRSADLRLSDETLSELDRISSRFVHETPFAEYRLS